MVRSRHRVNRCRSENKIIGFFGRSATFGRKLKCLDPIFLTETGKNFANRVVAKILTYPRRKKVSEAKIGSFQIVLNFLFQDGGS